MRNVLDQFTRQAVPFSKLQGHAEANRLLIEQANIPGDGEKVRALYEADVGVDQLGMGASASGKDVLFSYPITVAVGTKPA